MEHIPSLKNLPSPAPNESLPYWFQGNFAASFVFNFCLREFLLSALVNRFELRCEPKRLMLLYYKICPCLFKYTLSENVYAFGRLYGIKSVWPMFNSKMLIFKSEHQIKSSDFSQRASPTISVELKFPVELNSFSDASRVCEPATESLFLVTCRLRENTELFSFVNKQSIVLRSHFALRRRHFAIRMK